MADTFSGPSGQDYGFQTGRGLDAEPLMQHRRAPGSTCLSALHTGAWGRVDNRIKNFALMALSVGMAPSRSHRGSSPLAWPSAPVLPGPCASPDSWGDFWWRHHGSGASIP